MKLILACILIKIFDCINGLSINMISNGCTSFDCKRTCMEHDVTQTPGDNGFKVFIEGSHDRYIPNKTYKISVIGNKIKNSLMEYRGFLLVAVPQDWYDAMPFFPLGKFKIKSNDPDVRYSVGCSEMLTHTNFESKYKVTAYWTAPPSGSGCVSFRAMIMQTETLWFKDDGALTQVMCEDDSTKDPSIIPPCCACGEAKYSLSFQGIWSKHTHPRDWPENEWLTHWSNIIGAVHNRNYSIWEIGGYASPGLKELAEFGVIRSLEEELKNHSSFGNIRNIVVANGLWYPNVNKETSSVFSVSNTHYLLTFAAMLGPSPDWLSGVSKLNLCLPNCTWLESHTENLYPFDAGTDSGVSYNSPNRPTVPQEKIHKISSSFPNNPKSPFYDPSGKPIESVAKLVIKQQLVRGTQCPNGERNGIDQKSSESDFDPNDLSDPIKRDKILNNQGARKKNIKETKIIEIIDSRCMTTDWSEWTECSSSCGNGLRKRHRQYKDAKAAMGVCNEIIDDNEMCLSSNGECETDDNEAFNIADMCLFVTSWSSWSPCSVTCGVGSTMRIREFMKKDLESKCNTQLVDKKNCRPKIAKCKDGNMLPIEEKKRICMLEKKPGPCKMLTNTSRYYFDTTMKKCLPFSYGGCKGNENNFITAEECQQMCNIMLDVSNLQAEEKNKHNLEEKKNLCMLPKEEGSCYDSIQRFYFDRTKLMCTPLEYSGCGGNDNNFETMTACESKCHQVIHLIKEEDNMKTINQVLTIPEKKKICMSPKQKGQCEDLIPRFFFDINMAKCLPFEYSGCEGNLNNFETAKECEMACDVLIDMARQALDNDEQANEELKNKEMCMQPKEVGPCNNYMDKYYFDTLMGKCMKFSFGGCNPNDNNFESISECETTCTSLIEMNMNAKSPNINMESNQMGAMERKSICKLPVHEGSCLNYLKRYYFNSFLKDCEPFAYTGCDGNENNFITYEACKKTCFDMMEDSSTSSNDFEKNENFHPIDCMLTEWSLWSECSSIQCGKKGKSYRTREIKQEAKYGGELCPKELNETRICHKNCNTNGENVDCIVGQWQLWSECRTVKSCEGYQERQRPVIRKAQFDGLPCPKLKERRKCFIGKCDSMRKIKNLH